MSEVPGNLDDRLVEAEFRRRFWRARDEHARLREHATVRDPAHLAAMEFAQSQGWEWGELLLEASRCVHAVIPEQATPLLNEAKRFIRNAWQSLFQFVSGEMLISVGDSEAAVAMLRVVAGDSKFDSQVRALTSLGRALQSAGDLRSALTSYRQAIDLGPVELTAAPWNNIGTIHSQFDELQEELAAYHRAIELPENLQPTIAWCNIGRAYYEQADYGGAVEAYRRAMDNLLFFPPANSWYDYGVVLTASGEYKQGVKAFLKALADPLRENLADILFGLGDALYRSGNFLQATEVLRRLLHDPAAEPGMVWNYLGLVHASCGEKEEAAKAFRKAMESPGYQSVHTTWESLGITYWERFNFDAALNEHKWAILELKRSSRGLVCVEFGRAYIEMGKLDLARQALQQALQHADDSGEIHPAARALLKHLDQTATTAPIRSLPLPRVQA